MGHEMLDAHVPASWQAWTWPGPCDALGLQLQSVPARAPAPGQVLVRNAAIGLNPVDWKVLGGLDSWTPGQVPGVDGAGVVVAVGEGVAPAWCGRRVAYHQTLAGPGSFAAYTPVAERALLRLPDGLDFETATAFPCPGLTAWQALAKLPARPGRLLVSGAGGSVGHYLVALARRAGHEVDVLCHARHAWRLLAAGVRCAHASVAEVLAAGERYDAIVDTVGAARAAELAALLRANGHLVCVQGRVAAWPHPPFGRAVSLHEVALGALHREGDDADWADLRQAGESLLAGLADGRLPPESLHHPARFDELAATLDGLRHRRFDGKAVVSV